MIVYQPRTRTRVPVSPLRTRCIFTAAADTPAHGETGVRKPLANTEAHTREVSYYTSYHPPCYPEMIIIKVSHVVIMVVAVVLRRALHQKGVIRWNSTTVGFVLECLNCNLEVICMSN